MCAVIAFVPCLIKYFLKNQPFQWKFGLFNSWYICLLLHKEADPASVSEYPHSVSAHVFCQVQLRIAQIAVEYFSIANHNFLTFSKFLLQMFLWWSVRLHLGIIPSLMWKSVTVLPYTSSFVLFSLLLFEFHFGVCVCSDFPSSSTAGYTQECAVSSLQLALLGWGQCTDEKRERRQ